MIHPECALGAHPCGHCTRQRGFTVAFELQAQAAVHAFECFDFKVGSNIEQDIRPNFIVEAFISVYRRSCLKLKENCEAAPPLPPPAAVDC
eukprot:1007066-Prorocentrum_minimum.AAC.1